MDGHGGLDVSFARLALRRELMLFLPSVPKRTGKQQLSLPVILFRDARFR